MDCMQHASLPCTSLFPEVCSGSCPLSQWRYLSCPQVLLSSPPAFNLFQHQGLFQWVGPSHQMAKELELQLQQWLSHEYSRLISLGLTGLISLLSKGLSWVFSSTTVQKHQCSAFFTVQLSHPYITMGKTIALTRRTLVDKVMSLLLNILSYKVVILSKDKD